jgi:chromosome partitioning protein
VDADKQRSASDFTLVRKEALASTDTGYTAIQLTGMAVRDEVHRLAAKYDDIVIDVGGRDTTEQRAAIAISHVYAVPVVPSSYDLWALEQVAELIEEGKAFNPNLHALCFISRAPVRGTEVQEALTLMAEISQFEVIDSVIAERKAWRTSTAKGLSVYENKPSDKKAQAELKALYEALFDERFEPKRKQKRRGK